MSRLLSKREEFEKKAEKDRQDLNKDFMERMMGCDQNHSKEIDIYNRPFNEKMQIVKDFKEKGNDYFKEENYEKASYFYAKALLQFYYIIPENDEEENEVNPIKLSCHLNQALWFYKQSRFDEGLTEWYQALCIDPNNVKGLYRQALLNKSKHNFEKALEDVKHGLEIDPKNHALLELHKTLKDDMKNYIKTSKKVYGKMMEGDKDQSTDLKELQEPKEIVKDSKEDPKVVEIHDEPKVVEINEEEAKVPPKENNQDELLLRLEKLEKTVEEIKFWMDILKGYGAIPLKMTEEEEKKEAAIKEVNKEEQKGNWTTDDWISIVSLVVLAIVLSVTFSVLLVKFTMVVQSA